jgi:hypothetical protein
MFDRTFQNIGVIAGAYHRLRLLLHAYDPRTSIRLQLQLVDLYHLMRRVAFRVKRDEILESKLKTEAQRYIRAHDMTGFTEEFVTDATAMCIIAAMADDTNDSMAREIYTLRNREMARCGLPVAETSKISLLEVFGYTPIPNPGFHQGLVERYVRAVSDLRPLDATVLSLRMMGTTYLAAAAISGPFTNYALFRSGARWTSSALQSIVRASVMSAYHYTIDTA